MTPRSKILLVLRCSFLFTAIIGVLPLTATAQTLYGTSPDDNLLFKYAVKENHFVGCYKWQPSIPGRGPVGNLVELPNGHLFGMTMHGGEYGEGVVFEYDPAANVYTVQKDFDGISGATPVSGLLLASDNKLYGTTLEGGANDKGVLFSFDPETKIFSKILDFDGVSKGAYPVGHLSQVNNGKLYGTTTRGGNSNHGIVFTLDISSQTYTKIFDFNQNTDGSYPHSLTYDGNDKLYGITGNTDPPRYPFKSIIFEIDITTNVFTIKESLDNYESRSPLFIGNNNRAYAAGENKLYEFEFPSFQLLSAKNISDSDYDFSFKITDITTEGKILGFSGNSLFAYDPETTVLNLFTGHFGLFGRYDGFSESESGNLYAAIANSQDGGIGLLVRLNRHDYSAETLTYFNVFENGAIPVNLVKGLGNYLTGTTTRGGRYGKGVLYSVDIHNLEYHKKADLKDRPVDLVVTNHLDYLSLMNNNADDGVLALYDQTSESLDTIGYPGRQTISQIGRLPNGRIFAAGGYDITIFEYDTTAKALVEKLKITDPVDGELPTDLIQLNGKLYGVGSHGGANYVLYGSYSERDYLGVFFEYDHINNRYSKKFDFNKSTMNAPRSLITFNGKIYGVTGNGSIFEFDPLADEVTIHAIDTLQEKLEILISADDQIYGLVSTDNNTSGGFDASALYLLNLQDHTASFLLNFVNEHGQPIYVNNLVYVPEVVTSTDGPDNKGLREDLAIYPNPFENQLIVGLQSFTSGKQVTVKIISAQGKLVNTLSGFGGNNLTADLSHLNTGLYFVTAQSGVEKYTWKIFKK
jgi:uncharacterized repeat protein (TIGR03803 family)